MRSQILFVLVLFAMTYEYHCISVTDNKTLWDWDAYANNTKSKYGTQKKPYNNDNSDYYGGQNSYDNNNNNNYDNDNKNSYNKNDNGNSYNNDDKNSYNNNDDDYKPSQERSSRSRKSPDEYGNMNIYFREPSNDGRRRKPKRHRFPVLRYERNRFPPFPPLLSFLPYLPIFADRLTKQTIIYSPTGGIYIIPPVINFYGMRFSVAELIASGYCSLVSSGVPPPPAIDVAPLVQPGIVTGPGIPTVNTATGGFKGGVRTEYRTLSRPKYPKTLEEEGGSGYQQRDQGSQGGYGY